MRVYTRALKQIPESCEFTLVLLCGKDIPHGLLMSVKHNILINQEKKKSFHLAEHKYQSFGSHTSSNATLKSIFIRDQDQGGALT